MTASRRGSRAAGRVVASLALAGALASVRAGAPAGPLTDPAPAFSAPLALDGPGPYYTLSLPLALQSAANRADLDDLQVRNAGGDLMPTAWLPQRTATAQIRQVATTLYKVPAPQASGAASAPAPAQSWIVDAHDSDAGLLRLELTLAAGTEGVYTVDIEASDDLQRWRPVQQAAQLVQLRRLALPASYTASANDWLTATDIDLGGVSARYLRLTTPVGRPSPTLASATLTRTRRQVAETAIEWSEAIAPSSCAARHCDYALPRNVRIEQVQVVLADPDTVGKVTLYGAVDRPLPTTHRRHLLHYPLHVLRPQVAPAPGTVDAVSWQALATANVYWLQQAAGTRDLRSPPVWLDGDRWPALRLESGAPMAMLGRTPPTIRIGAHPRTLVFLARGAGPFHIERATPDDLSATLSLAELMPARGADDPLPADTATPRRVPATTRPAAPPPPGGQATNTSPRTGAPWLWAALLVGLALMGGMAWSLLRKPAIAPVDKP